MILIERSFYSKMQNKILKEYRKKNQFLLKQQGDLFIQTDDDLNTENGTNKKIIIQ